MRCLTAAEEDEEPDEACVPYGTAHAAVASLVLLTSDPRRDFRAEFPGGDENGPLGATYNGTVAGGTPVSLTVSPDGSGITSFTAAGPLEAGDSTFSDITWTYSGAPLAIANHTFSDSDPEMSVIGSFRWAAEDGWQGSGPGRPRRCPRSRAR
jgi:hypothetical protein